MNEDDRKLESEIAANERWLGGIRTPPPRAEALDRTKLAVRGEVARVQWGSRSRRRWIRWTGVGAAAAVLVMGVSVGWYLTRSPESPAVAYDGDSPLATWLTDANEELTRFASIEDGLADLEEWSASDRWSADGASMYEAMDDALEGESDEVKDQKGATAPVPGNLHGMEVSHGIS